MVMGPERPCAEGGHLKLAGGRPRIVKQLLEILSTPCSIYTVHARASGAGHAYHLLIVERDRDCRNPKLLKHKRDTLDSLSVFPGIPITPLIYSGRAIHRS